MFGSAALETAIGLAAMFFILATAASAITEWFSRLFNKRAKDLERALGALLKGDRKHGLGAAARNPDVQAALKWLKETSVWKSAEASAGVTLFKRNLKKPNYLSAKMFADAVTEMLAQHPLSPVENPTTRQTAVAKGSPPATAPQALAITETLKAKPGEDNEVWPENLKLRLDALVAEGRTDLLSLKAGLEGWFDESMSRAQGAYKRWATVILFALGLAMAIGLNLSTIQVSTTLWQQPATRDAVANASAKMLEDGASADKINNLTETQKELTALKIPGGWNDKNWEAWKTWDAGHADRKFYDVVGWLLTAFLVMLGAPFWFDALSKLVSLRSTGSKPPTAGKDDTSATTAAAAATTPVADQVTVQGTTVTTGTTVSSAITPAGPAKDDFARKVGLIR